MAGTKARAPSSFGPGELAGELLAARTLPAVHAALSRYLAGHGAEAVTLHGQRRDGRTWTVPSGAASAEEPCSGRRCWPLPRARGQLCASFSGDERVLVTTADLADLCLVELFRRRRLRRQVRKARRAVALQRALYAISDVASGPLDRAEVLSRIHRIVAGLMYAENFFIALYDAGRRTLRFAYFADEKDDLRPDPDAEYAEDELPNSLTLAVIRRGEALRGPSAQLARQLGFAYDESAGPDCEDWLGVPMLSEHGVRGAVVVQSYDPRHRYDEADRELLAYVAQHLLTALSRREAQEEMEALIARRTGELARANQELREEVAERQAGERLQAALFRIAELSSTAASAQDFFAAVHGVVGELLYAENFIIALLCEAGFEFPYAVDSHDSGALFAPRPLRRGLVEYVIRSGRSLLATRAEIDALAARGEVQSVGTPSVCWLGVPLILDGRPIGALVVQSYLPEVLFGERDRELLTFVSFHIATAIRRRDAQLSLKRANIELERRVEDLRVAQQELIETEKMASLGRLVAGVAHEINTPLGIAVTAVSFLRNRLVDLAAELPATARESLDSLSQAAAMVEGNVHRAANLVRTFKQVAVDQSSSAIRSIYLRETLEGSLLSLNPLLRKGRHQLEMDCDQNLKATTRPDALHQILVGLITNSLQHAFPDGRQGHLTLRVTAEEDRLAMHYGDDGVGMDPEVAAHAFEPFYTTRRELGGTGLGLHIVYNLATHALCGRIRCDTRPGAGTRFEISFPRELPRP